MVELPGNMSQYIQSRVLRIIPAAPERTSNTRAVRRYDEASGQIYHETTRYAPTSSETLWYKTAKTRTAAGRRVPSSEVIPKLFTLALRSAITHSSSFTAESLDEMPWHIVRLIWKAVDASPLDTLAAWQAVASVFGPMVRKKYPDDSPFEPQPKDVERLLHRRQSLLKPNLPLSELTPTITSPSYQWITFLTICGPTDHLRSSLVNLTRLVNLGALDILDRSESVSSNPAVTDSLVRAWRRAARDDDAFLKLKVLMLRNHKGITAQTLLYISDFPALQIFNCNDCSIRRGDKHAPNKTGSYWILMGKQSELHDQFGETNDVPAEKRFWYFPIKAAYEYVACFDEDLGIVRSPILNFRVGGTSEEDRYALSKAPLIFYRNTPLIEPWRQPRRKARAGVKRRNSSDAAVAEPKRSKFRDSRHVDVGSMLREFAG